MALLDKQLVFSDAQEFLTGTTVSTNTVDLGAVGTVPFVGGSPSLYPSRGSDMKVLVQVVTTCTSGGSNTTEANVITSAAAALTSPTVIASSEAIAVATLVAGYKFRGMALTPHTAQRYLGVQYVVAAADLTAGAFDAWLALDAQTTIL